MVSKIRHKSIGAVTVVFEVHLTKNANCLIRSIRTNTQIVHSII